MAEAVQNEVKPADASAAVETVEGDAVQDAAARAAEVAAAATQAAMAKAVEGGYREPPTPTREARVKALIAGVEHAMAHNGPMTVAMLAELKSLLGGE